MSFNTFYLNSENSGGIIDGSNVVVGGRLGVSIDPPLYTLDVSGTTRSNNLIANTATITNFDISGETVNIKSLQTKVESTEFVTMSVIVGTKTSKAFNSSGSSNGYFINNIETPYLHFTSGKTYRFDQSNSTNSSHPILFYLDEAKTSQYSTGVTTNPSSNYNGGTSGNYVEISITSNTPNILYYQCQNHSYMGGKIYVKGSNVTSITSVGTLTAGTWNAAPINKQYINTQSISINDLSNVNYTASSMTEGQTLVWNPTGQNWVPGTIALDSLPSSIYLNGGKSKVMEKIAGVCDGRTISGEMTNYTLQSVSTYQDISTTLVDVQGSSITYSPPTNASQVVYTFVFNIVDISNEASMFNQSNDLTIRFYIDGTEVTNQKAQISSYLYNNGSIYTFTGIIDIGNVSSNDIANGKLVSWATGKTLKLKASNSEADYPIRIFAIKTVSSNQYISEFIPPTLQVSSIGNLNTYPFENTTINDLSDVSFNSTTTTDGQALVWNSTDAVWEAGVVAGTGSGGLADLSASSISDLSDVSFNSTTTTDGQALVWNSTDAVWEAGVVASGSISFINLTDTPSTFTATKFLAVNSSGNAVEFVDAPESGINIDETTDISLNNLKIHGDLSANDASFNNIDTNSITVTSTTKTTQLNASSVIVDGTTKTTQLDASSVIVDGTINTTILISQSTTTKQIDLSGQTISVDVSNNVSLPNLKITKLLPAVPSDISNAPNSSVGGGTDLGDAKNAFRYAYIQDLFISSNSLNLGGNAKLSAGSDGNIGIGKTDENGNAISTSLVQSDPAGQISPDLLPFNGLIFSKIFTPSNTGNSNIVESELFNLYNSVSDISYGHYIIVQKDCSFSDATSHNNVFIDISDNDLNVGDLLIYTNNEKFVKVKTTIPTFGIKRQHIADGEIISSKLDTDISLNNITVTNEIVINNTNVRSNILATIGDVSVNIIDISENRKDISDISLNITVLEQDILDVSSIASDALYNDIAISRITNLQSKLNTIDSSINDISNLVVTKQSTLTAGTNITIIGNTIYASGGITDLSASSATDLSDISFNSATTTNGQALIWDSTNKLWKPGTVATSTSTTTNYTTVMSLNPGDFKVLEKIAGICDGRTISGESVGHTLKNVTTYQDISTTLVDVEGSSISYNPPNNAKQVLYNFRFNVVDISNEANVFNQNHTLTLRLYIDGVEITNQKAQISSYMYNHGHYFNYSAIIDIGSVESDNIEAGKYASWTSNKVIKLMASNSHGDYPARLFSIKTVSSGAYVHTFVPPSIELVSVGDVSDISFSAISVSDLSDVSFNSTDISNNQPLTWNTTTHSWEPSTTMSIDTINEKTTNNGVVIENVTLKNGFVTVPSDISAHRVYGVNYFVGSKNIVSASAQANFNDLEVKNSINNDITLLVLGQSGVMELSGTFKTDIIEEKTNNNGVDIESVNIKNGSITAGTNGSVSATNFNIGSRNIVSATAQANFTDLEVKNSITNTTTLLVLGQSGVMELSGTFKTDIIEEKTSNSGVNIEDVLLKDGDISANDVSFNNIHVLGDIRFNGNLYQNGSLFQSGSGGGGLTDLSASSINDLSDVSFNSTSTTDGQALVWNSTDGVWQAGTVASSGGLTDLSATSISDLSDVSLNGIQVDQSLKWDGEKLIPFTPGSTSYYSSTIENISDIIRYPGYDISSSSKYNNNYPVEFAFSRLTAESNGIWISATNKYSNGSYIGSESTNSYSGEWVQINFGKNVKVYSYTIVTQSVSNTHYRGPGNYKLFGSNNGTSWTDVHTGSASLSDYSGDYNAIKENTLTTPSTYQYFRLVINSTVGNDSIGTTSLQYLSLQGTFEEPDIVTSVMSGLNVSFNNLDISGVLGTNKSNNQISLGSHLIPTTNSTYDLGSAEYKIRHLFLSSNSLWVGENHKIEISNGKMKFRKLQKDTLPSGLSGITGASLEDAVAVLGKTPGSNASTFSLADWEAYSIAKGNPLKVDDIFQPADINDDDGLTDTINSSDISFNVVDASGLNVFGTASMQSIIPPITNTYSLGSATHVWRDVYIGPGSLYIDGQKVLESDADTIVVAADTNQNLKLNTTGTGVLQIESAAGIQISSTGAGNIELGSTGTGIVRITDNLALNGNVEIFNDSSDMVKINDSLLVTGDISFNGNLYQNGSLFTGGSTIDETTDVSLNNIKIHGDLSANDASFNVIDATSLRINGVDIIDGAPEALNTLNELATALDNSANFATNVLTTLSNKQDTLTAGTNITITGNTISASGGGGSTATTSSIGVNMNFIKYDGLTTVSVSQSPEVELTMYRITITPTSTNSVIELKYNLFGYIACDAVYRIVREVGGNSTEFYNTNKGDVAWSGIVAPYYQQYGSTPFAQPILFYDEPNTTSEVTYKLTINNSSATTSTYYVNQGTSPTGTTNAGESGISTVSIIEHPKTKTLVPATSITKQGQVLETLAGVCDGRSVTVESGTYTLPNVTQKQEISSDTTYEDLTGSNISYKPPSGTKQIIYKMLCQVSRGNNGGSQYIGMAYRLYIDGVQCGQTKHINNLNYGDGYLEFEYVIDIGTNDMTNGKISSWTTNKTVKLMCIERSSSADSALHISSYNSEYGESDSEVMKPHLEIVAIGESAGQAVTLTNNSVSDLSDISFNSTTTTDGQALVWNSTDAVWEAGTVASGSSSPWTTNSTDIYYNSGNVGIGTTGPLSKLHVLSPTGSYAFQVEQEHSGGDFRLTYNNDEFNFWRKSGGSYSATNMYLNYNGGTVYYSGSNAVTSDNRMKHNETEIVNALDTINKLKIYRYFKTNYKRLYDASHNFTIDSSGNPITQDDYSIESGVISQDILNIPELKYVVKEGAPADASENHYTVLYNEIFVYNLKATQELHQLVESQQTTIQTHETTIQSQQQEINDLKQEIQAIKQHLGI